MNNISIQGNDLNIEVRKNQLYVNGKLHTDLETIQQKEIYITVNGTSNNIKTGSGDITVKGDVLQTVQAGSGDILVEGSVNNNVQTGSGDVVIKGSVKGNVQTGSGNIKYAS